MMSQRMFSATTGVIFLLIAVLHALRVVFGMEAVLEGWALPMWVSWVAALIAAYLASQGFRLSKKS
jgi:hypothetical protein